VPDRLDRADLRKQVNESAIILRGHGNIVGTPRVRHHAVVAVARGTASAVLEIEDHKIALAEPVEAPRRRQTARPGTDDGNGHMTTLARWICTVERTQTVSDVNGRTANRAGNRLRRASTARRECERRADE